MYRDVVTGILLGEQWGEVSDFIGLWGMMSAVAILFNTYGSCVCIAKGRPRLSAIAQIAQIVVLFPVVYITSRMDFRALYTARTFVRIEGILVFVLIMKLCFRISIFKMLRGLLIPVVCTGIMVVAASALRTVSNTFCWNIISIGVCTMLYFAVMLLFPKERDEILSVVHGILRKVKDK